MLSPALAAVLSALNPLPMAAAAVAVVAVAVIAVVAVVAALYWLGGRKPGRSAVATDADAAPGCDSGFAAEAAAAADTAQRAGAPHPPLACCRWLPTCWWWTIQRWHAPSCDGCLRPQAMQFSWRAMLSRP